MFAILPLTQSSFQRLPSLETLLWLKISGASFCPSLIQKSLHGTTNLSACLSYRKYPVRSLITLDISFRFYLIRPHDLLLFHSDHIVLVTWQALSLRHLELTSLMNNTLWLSLQVECDMLMFLLDGESGRKVRLLPSSSTIELHVSCQRTLTRFKGKYLDIMLIDPFCCYRFKGS